MKFSDGLGPGGLVGSSAACEIAGISARQVVRWVALGIVRPTVRGKGSGFGHGWSEADTNLLWALGQLAADDESQADRSAVRARMFRRVAKEARDMDLSHGWLLCSPKFVRWVGTVADLAVAVAGLRGSYTVVGLGGERAESGAEAA